MLQIAVIHGPNLNLLGRREPDVYGQQTLDDINAGLQQTAQQLNVALTTVQSNAEHELVDFIQQTQAAGIIINPAAFTHTSVALRDALLAVNIPFIEVHLSNVHAREAFRDHSYFSDVAEGCIVGLGAAGYEAALRYFANTLT